MKFAIVQIRRKEALFNAVQVIFFFRTFDGVDVGAVPQNTPKCPCQCPFRLQVCIGLDRYSKTSQYVSKSVANVRVWLKLFA